MIKEKFTTLATAVSGMIGIEVVNQVPTDPTFYSELFKILLQIIIAIISLFKLLKSQKDESK